MTFTKTGKPSDPTTQDHTITEGVKSFGDQLPDTHQIKPETESSPVITDTPIPIPSDPDKGIYKPEFAPKDFQQGPWLNPENSIYSRGKQSEIIQPEMVTMTCGSMDIKRTEGAFIVLAKDEPNNYKDAMNSPNAAEWRPACEAEYETLLGYHTWNLVERFKSSY